MPKRRESSSASRMRAFSQTNSEGRGSCTLELGSDAEDPDYSPSEVILEDFDRIAAKFRRVSVRVGASSEEQTTLLTELLQFIIPECTCTALRQHDRITALLSFAMQCIQAGDEPGIRVAVAIIYRVSLDPENAPCVRETLVTQALLQLAERGTAKPRDVTIQSFFARRTRTQSGGSSDHSPRKRTAEESSVRELVNSVCRETLSSELYRQDLCWVNNVSTISLVILRRIKDEETRSTPVELATYSRLAQQEGLCFRRVENQTAENALRLFLMLELIDDMDTLQALAFDSYIFVAILRASDRRGVKYLSELLEKSLRILTLLTMEETDWAKWEALTKSFLKILFDLPSSSFLWAECVKADIKDDEQAVRLLALGILGSLSEASALCARAIANSTVKHKVPQKVADLRILEILSDCYQLLPAKDPSETKYFSLKDHYTSVTKCTLAVVLAHLCGGMDGYNRLIKRGCSAASFLEALRLFLIVLQKADLLQDDAVARIDNAMQRWQAYEAGKSPDEPAAIENSSPRSDKKASLSTSKASVAPKSNPCQLHRGATAHSFRFSPKKPEAVNGQKPETAARNHTTKAASSGGGRQAPPAKASSTTSAGMPNNPVDQAPCVPDGSSHRDPSAEVTDVTMTAPQLLRRRKSAADPRIVPQSLFRVADTPRGSTLRRFPTEASSHTTSPRRVSKRLLLRSATSNTSATPRLMAHNSTPRSSGSIVSPKEQHASARGPAGTNARKAPDGHGAVKIDNISSQNTPPFRARKPLLLRRRSTSQPSVIPFVDLSGPTGDTPKNVDSAPSDTAADGGRGGRGGAQLPELQESPASAQHASPKNMQSQNNAHTSPKKEPSHERSSASTASPQKPKSAIKAKSPPRAKSLPRPKSPTKAKSPQRAKSPAKTKAPTKAKFPSRTKSPLKEKSPTQAKSPPRVKSPAKARSTLRENTPPRIKSPTKAKLVPKAKSSNNQVASSKSVPISKCPTRSRTPVRKSQGHAASTTDAKSLEHEMVTTANVSTSRKCSQRSRTPVRKSDEECTSLQGRASSCASASPVRCAASPQGRVSIAKSPDAGKTPRGERMFADAVVAQKSKADDASPQHTKSPEHQTACEGSCSSTKHHAVTDPKCGKKSSEHASARSTVPVSPKTPQTQAAVAASASSSGTTRRTPETGAVTPTAPSHLRRTRAPSCEIIDDPDLPRARTPRLHGACDTLSMSDALSATVSSTRVAPTATQPVQAQQQPSDSAAPGDPAHPPPVVTPNRPLKAWHVHRAKSDARTPAVACVSSPPPVAPMKRMRRIASNMSQQSDVVPASSSTQSPGGLVRRRKSSSSNDTPAAARLRFISRAVAAASQTPTVIIDDDDDEACSSHKAPNDAAPRAGSAPARSIGKKTTNENTREGACQRVSSPVRSKLNSSDAKGCEPARRKSPAKALELAKLELRSKSPKKRRREGSTIVIPDDPPSLKKPRRDDPLPPKKPTLSKHDSDKLVSPPSSTAKARTPAANARARVKARESVKSRNGRKPVAKAAKNAKVHASKNAKSSPTRTNGKCDKVKSRGNARAGWSAGRSKPGSSTARA